MVRTQCFHCHGLGSIPDWGTKIPQATRQKKKKELQGIPKSKNTLLRDWTRIRTRVTYGRKIGIIRPGIKKQNKTMINMVRALMEKLTCKNRGIM